MFQGPMALTPSQPGWHQAPPPPGGVCSAQPVIADTASSDASQSGGWRSVCAWVSRIWEGFCNWLRGVRLRMFGTKIGTKPVTFKFIVAELNRLLTKKTSQELTRGESGTLQNYFRGKKPILGPEGALTEKLEDAFTGTQYSSEADSLRCQQIKNLLVQIATTPRLPWE